MDLSILPHDNNGNIVMELFSCVISEEDFASRFDGATLTHDSLYNHPNATPGWKTQFDSWKEQGILN